MFLGFFLFGSLHKDLSELVPQKVYIIDGSRLVLVKGVQLFDC